jgi:hypothetical protein
MTGDDAAGLLRTAAERLERLAARTTGGDWRLAGLLATRPEVVAHAADGGSEHVAEARGGPASGSPPSPPTSPPRWRRGCAPRPTPGRWTTPPSTSPAS